MKLTLYAQNKRVMYEMRIVVTLTYILSMDFHFHYSWNSIPSLFLNNSETVKFGHVTFFWNGNRSGYINSEREYYVEIPSNSIITFNVKPKMKALEIGEKARDAILSGKFDQVNKPFCPLNYLIQNI